MILTLLDTNFNPIEVIDVFESFIWTDRYCGYGDFEWYTSMNDPLVSKVKIGEYLRNDESDRMMIIEAMEITTNIEEGNHIKITGRSLESILDRRIIWNQSIYEGRLDSAIYDILDKAIINPTIVERKIDNFIIEQNDDPKIAELTLNSQYTGDVVYEVIRDICEDAKMGFKITLNEDNQFVFKLYFGVNRSESQSEQIVVKFCEDLDNLISSNYLNSEQEYKNVTLVAGEGEGNARKTAIVGEASGLDRRELYTDARDLSTKSSGGTIPDAKYLIQLQQRGKEKLTESKVAQVFEGEVDTSRLYMYNRDFFMGDIVQMENEFGFKGAVRVNEMVMDWGTEGYSAYPNFVVMDEEDLNE